MLLVGLALAQPHPHSTGLRTYILTDSNANAVDIATAIAVGQVDDPVGAEGMAHGVEHLWFEARVDGVAVMEHLDRLGCSVNAFTGAEWMLFVESCPAAALSEVLALEATRFEPWNLDEGAAREWRVLAEEELIRAERSEIVEDEFVNRQLLSPRHPVRQRAARSHHAPFPGLAALERFVEAQFRRDRSAMVIAGAADPDAARAALDLRFGPSSVATSLAPLRTAPEARRVLRMAPRAVPGIAQTPRVIVGWSQRAPGGLSGQVADLHIELVLRSALLHDPRVASVGCGHQDVLFNRTFTCTIALLDDDTVNAIAGELPAILEDLDPARAEGRLLEFVSIQAGLWGLVAFQQHVAGTGSFATWRARTLLEGVSIDEPKEDLRRWARESMLAETALILALPGGATPRADFPRPEPVAEGAPSEAAPVALPPPTPALVTAHRILQNGLELVAVQRPDAVLLHQALAAQAPQDPSVARAIHGVIDNQKLDPYIIDVGAGNGTTRYRQVAMIPGFPLAAAERLLGGIRSLGWQP